MTEQSTEATNFSPEELAAQDDQVNLDYFLTEVGAYPAMDQLRPDHLRTIAETTLWLELEAEKPEGLDKDPQAVLWKFLESDSRGYFVPKNRSETETIIHTPEVRLARAAAVKRTEPLASAKTTYLEMLSRKKDSETELELIKQVISGPEGEDYQPDIQALRANRDVLNMAADHLVQRKFLLNNHWPARNTHEYKDTRKYMRGLMLASANWAGDEVLSAVVKADWESTKNRFRYWNEKVAAVARTTAGIAVKNALDSPEPKEIQDETGEDDLDRTETDPPEERQDPKKIEVQSYEELIPLGEEPELLRLANEFSGKAHRIETLARQSMSRHQAEISVLGAPGVYYKGHLVGVEPKDDRPSATAIAQAKRPARNPAKNPGVRRLPGYDHQQDPSNPRPF